ncbi:S-methyl-5'-thioadenosine phosphorylase [bacterium]|nr:S-methyl-5'-thioadenosine phosphorylase [bacterium]
MTQNNSLPTADIGVFGGSGFYSLFNDAESLWIDTPYGAPSAKITIADVGGKKVAFLPRHGVDHSFPPHRVPYRANLWAMKSIGVKKILAPCAVGSLQPELKPGSFVICDQFVDRTSGRASTFFDGPKVTHVSTADPYCPTLRQQAIAIGQEMNLDIHGEGTMVVIEGPRFSTRAESKWFSSMGWSVVGMTGFPECVLARELEMCYVNISLVTDYDVGTEGLVEPVTMEEVARVFAKNTQSVKDLILKLCDRIDVNEDCSCMHALSGAN